MAAGLGFSRENCVALIGGAMALSLKYGRADLSIGRKPSWSRVARLVDRFKMKYGTTSCAELTRQYTVDDFPTPVRINYCCDIIDFACREAALLLFDPDETFDDPEKEAYFNRRENRTQR